MISRRHFCLGGALAATSLAMLPSAAFAADPAVQRIESFYSSVQATMRRANGLSVQGRYQALSPAVLSTFDVARMTSIAVGPSWNSMSGGQRSAITSAFGRFLVATYARRVDGYAGERFEVSPQTQQRSAGRLVRTRVTDSGGSVTNVDYVVGSGGRAIDVYLNGSISELASRSAEFSSILARGGPEELLASLEKRSATILAGG